MNQPMTIEELANETGIRSSLLRRWVRAGKLHPMPTPTRTRSYLFDEAGLQVARELAHAWALLRKQSA